MKNNNLHFCNEFYPEHEGYTYKHSEDNLKQYSECRHCIFKNSAKCKASPYQDPTIDFYC